jgi:hypothetical protein
MAAIRDTNWETDIELALEEARRIDAEEEERQKTAEGKAQNHLMLVGVVVPFISFAEGITEVDPSDSVARWLSVIFLITASVYMAAAILWALRCLQVSNYVRVYASDLVELWKRPENLRKRLAVSVLTATRRNQDVINRKVFAISMAHAFIVRAILTLIFLLVVKGISSAVCLTSLLQGIIGGSGA